MQIHGGSFLSQATPWCQTIECDFGKIDFLSAVPLHIETYANKADGSEVKLSDATGFVTRQARQDFLVTNWHVVSGLAHSEENNPSSPVMHQSGLRPKKLKVWHHGSAIGARKPMALDLYSDQDEKLWLEHPELKECVDVVAIPLSDVEGGIYHALDLSLSFDELMVTPAESLSAIGFPEGNYVGDHFPLWITGHVASDFDIDPHYFYIDALSREGMSGSPVFAKRVGVYQRDYTHGETGSVVRFLGIYSGRTSESSFVGKVWKPALLNDILKAFPV